MLKGFTSRSRQSASISFHLEGFRLACIWELMAFSPIQFGRTKNVVGKLPRRELLGDSRHILTNLWKGDFT